MKPLFVLLISFAIAVLVVRLIKKQFEWRLPGRIALSAMLLFTSLGHFMFTEGMAGMLPEGVPYREFLVYLTGFVEIAAAIGLLVPAWRRLTGYLLMLFFALVLPANIYAAIHHINYETGLADGPGLSYLWFRIPFQVLLIIWAYLSAVRRTA